MKDFHTYRTASGLSLFRDPKHLPGFLPWDFLGSWGAGLPDRGTIQGLGRSRAGLAAAEFHRFLNMDRTQTTSVNLPARWGAALLLNSRASIRRRLLAALDVEAYVEFLLGNRQIQDCAWPPHPLSFRPVAVTAASVASRPRVQSKTCIPVMEPRQAQFRWSQSCPVLGPDPGTMHS